MPKSHKDAKIPKTQNNGSATVNKKTARATIFSKSTTKTKKEKSIKRASSGVRVLQVPKRKWYNPLTWRYRQPVPNYKPLPKARKLFKYSIVQMWDSKKLFGGIVIIYGILNVVLVKGISGSSSLVQVRNAMSSVVHGVGGQLLTSTVSFGYLLVSSGSGNTATSGIYQAILIIVCSLAFIWALRKVIAKQKPRIRDSFYLGMYPLVPFVLVGLLISLQLVPLVAGGGLYELASNGGIMTSFWQKALFIGIFLLGAYWTFRMLTATIFALYIVTLPDMTPMRAYRSARDLVYGRRLLLWRKIIYLPVGLVVCAGIIEFPLIWYIPTLAEWAFFAISMLSLPIVHSYLYNLYREML